jgi:hypothetical protein
MSVCAVGRFEEWGGGGDLEVLLRNGPAAGVLITTAPTMTAECEWQRAAAAARMNIQETDEGGA